MNFTLKAWLRALTSGAIIYVILGDDLSKMPLVDLWLLGGALGGFWSTFK